MASIKKTTSPHNVCSWCRPIAERSIGARVRAILFALVATTTLLPGAAHAGPSASEMIERMLPSVVRITVHALTSSAEGGAEESFGSGFVVDPKGYILTNQHVVDRAYEIIITLNDGTIHHAKLVGTADDVDLALLKIESHHPLKAANFADSNETKIGEEVFAIGNPFGIGTTVTRGIVSAINRDLSRSTFDSYIQTDAAINRGNSGGPLVNGNGEVVGISTAYYRGTAEKGGSIGLGFAIPSTVAKTLIDLIRQYGYPRVGWLGVDGQTLTAEMASALGLDHKTGAILISVRADGPSFGALQPEDIILEVEGEKLLDMRMLQRAAVGSIGRPVRLKILRQALERQVVVTPTERPLSRPSNAKALRPAASAKAGTFGLTLSLLDERKRSELNLPGNVTGVYIANVATISAAAEAGLSKGDIIESIQLQTIRTEGDVTAALATLKETGRDFALLRVRSRDKMKFVTLHLIWQGPTHDPNN